MMYCNTIGCRHNILTAIGRVGKPEDVAAAAAAAAAAILLLVTTTN
jgi:hypothetical protein